MYKEVSAWNNYGWYACKTLSTNQPINYVQDILKSFLSPNAEEKKIGQYFLRMQVI